MLRPWVSALAVVLTMLLSVAPQYGATAPEAAGVLDNRAAERVAVAEFAEQVKLLSEELASLKALAKLGKGDVTVLELLAQIRELRSEVRRLRVDCQSEQRVYRGDEINSRGMVASVLLPERVVLISLGRDAGVLEGAVLRLGPDGVLARVVESRSKVSAAAVENSYKGKLAELVGCTAELSAR